MRNYLTKSLIFTSLIMMIFIFYGTAFASDEEYNITFLNNCGSARFYDEATHQDDLNVTKAKAGDRLLICAREPLGNNALEHWIINGEDTDYDEFNFIYEMPAHDVTFSIATCAAITSIEISGDYGTPEVHGLIPECNFTITKVNGGTELLDKVNLVFAKWVRVKDYVSAYANYWWNYMDYEDPSSEYFENAEEYMFVYKFETTDDDYAFKRYSTEVTIEVMIQRFLGLIKKWVHMLWFVIILTDLFLLKMVIIESLFIVEKVNFIIQKSFTQWQCLMAHI